MPIRAIATFILLLVTPVLPRHLRQWGQAMRQELTAIDQPGEALMFSVGCLSAAFQQTAIDRGHRIMTSARHLPDNPRRQIALAAIAATGLGIAYMGMAGAPARYLAMNAAALALAFLLCAAALQVMRLLPLREGSINIALSAVLLFTALLGSSVEGATRWVTFGGLFIQSSLILLPVMLLGFARTRDAPSAAALVVAALALAIQPDRAMSGVLAASLAVLAIIKADRATIAALAAATTSFVVTLLRPDTLPAVPYVDRILYTAFAVHPLAGIAVLTGAILLLVPAIIGAFRDPTSRDVHIAFGTVWLAIITAAALGNYPTPVVGYGGSAIIGYVLCLLHWPAASRRANVAATPSLVSARAEHRRLELAPSAPN